MTRRGTGPALVLLLAAGWCFAWAAWPATSARAQQSVRIDLGFAAANLVPPEALLGEWHAVISRDGHPQPVTLSIKQVTPGKTAGKMTFASPKRCFIDLEYGGPDQGRHIFYMIRFTNCFDYGRSDFIALAQVPGEDIAALLSEGAEEKSSKGAEILKKFGLGQPEPEPEAAQDTAAQDTGTQDTGTDTGTAATEKDPVAEPPKGLGRIVYAINLAGKVHDSAILKRQ